MPGILIYRIPECDVSGYLLSDLWILPSHLRFDHLNCVLGRKCFTISQLLPLLLLHLMPFLVLHYRTTCTELKKCVHASVGGSIYSMTLGSHRLFLFIWVTLALRVIFLRDISPADIKQKSDIFSLTRRKEKMHSFSSPVILNLLTASKGSSEIDFLQFSPLTVWDTSVRWIIHAATILKEPGIYKAAFTDGNSKAFEYSVTLKRGFLSPIRAHKPSDQWPIDEIVYQSQHGEYQSEGWKELEDLFVNLWEWEWVGSFLFWEWNKTKFA